MNEHPILAAWQSVVSEQSLRVAIFDGRGTPVCFFAEIEDLSRRRASQVLNGLAPGSLVLFQPENAELTQDPPTVLHTAALLLAALRQRVAIILADATTSPAFLSDVCRTAGVNRFIRLEPECKLTCAPVATAPPAWPGDPPALLKLTSGTSGLPRCVAFTEAALYADALQIMQTMRFGSEDRNLAAIPVSHSYGLGNILLPLLIGAVPAVICHDRTPRALLAAMQQGKATVFPGTPLLFQSLARLEDFPQLPTLRLCISAGALLRAETARLWRDRFGQPLHPFYGATECGGICYVRAPAFGDPEGFVGEPMEGVSLVALDADSASSRYAISSPALGQFYWPQPEPEVLDGRRFIPGDLLARVQTPRGYLIQGRMSDLIEVGGRKLDPRRIELFLEKTPGVEWVCVFGIPSARRGHDVIAAVVLEKNCRVSDTEILASLRRNFEPWQCPRAIWRLDAAPVNERGKISRNTLAATYATLRDQPLTESLGREIV
jgi:long-chain acyl-CoA synthetase